MKKSLKLGAACLGVALLLCACGKGSANSTDTAAGSETESAAQSASKIRTLMRMIMMLNPWSSSVITRD